MNQKELPKKISQNIKRLRLAANISQSELARRIGITPAAISYYENNGDRTPSIYILCELAKVFRVSIEELTGIKELSSEAFSEAKAFFSQFGQINNLSEENQQLVKTLVNNLLK